MSEFLTAHQVAQRLKVSLAWVRKHSAPGNQQDPRIPVVRFGRLVRFRVETIEHVARERNYHSV